ncbi:MAG: (Fe-S)-binding protein [Fimbriimonadales bacterium]
MNEQELYDKTVKCIRCGFCLEACPTFRITGQETESPRGRIYLVRSAIEGELNWKDTVKHLDRCLGCRACETACPSGVEYGDILEMAREKLEPQRPFIERTARTVLLNTVTKHPKLLAKLPFKKAPKLFSKGKAQQAELPRPESEATFPTVPTTKGTVNLLMGCVMDALYHPTNEAARYLIERQGYSVNKITQCCGALQKHSGKKVDQQQFKNFDGPIITTSAGCGSSLKDAGINAKDIAEFLYETDFQPPQNGQPITIAYQDACHLRHGQGIKDQPRQLLDRLPGVTRREIDDTCCGSAGIYNITQPEMARILLDQKWRAIEAAGVQTVVTGNPGCLAWISQAARENNSPIRVVHTARFIAERCHNKQA